MKLALIPPTSLSEYTWRSDYQLMLPQNMGSSTYALNYRKHCSRSDHFVILDNGAAEGEIVPDTELVDQATRYKVSEVVIPDVMGDFIATIARAEKFYEDFVPPRELKPLPFKLMFVLQGQTLLEVLESAHWALTQSWIDTLGIPRHLLDTLGDLKARVRVANIVSGKLGPGRDKMIHFLGANTLWPMEFRALSNPWVTNQDYLRGLDTSLPFTFTHAGQKITDSVYTLQEKLQRPENYFQTMMSEYDRNLLDYNVKQLLNLADGRTND